MQDNCLVTGQDPCACPESSQDHAWRGISDISDLALHQRRRYLLVQAPLLSVADLTLPRASPGQDASLPLPSSPSPAQHSLTGCKSQGLHGSAFSHLSASYLAAGTGRGSCALQLSGPLQETRVKGKWDRPLPWNGVIF